MTTDSSTVAMMYSFPGTRSWNGLANNLAAAEVGTSTAAAVGRSNEATDKFAGAEMGKLAAEAANLAVAGAYTLV